MRNKGTYNAYEWLQAQFYYNDKEVFCVISDQITAPNMKFKGEGTDVVSAFRDAYIKYNRHNKPKP